MKFENFNTGIDIDLKPLSSRQSIIVSKKLQEFAKNFPAKDGDINVAGSQAAEFLTDVAKHLIGNVYKLEVDGFEDAVSMTEICAFLRQQINKNGPSDFLTQPISSMITGLEKFSIALADAVDIAVKEAVDTARQPT